MLSVGVEIAHIRSRSARGPRYDPSWPKDQIDVEANLLLLCFEHHNWVDEHPDLYPAEELIAWKRAQVAQDSGIDLSDSQIAQVLDALTKPAAEVELVGVVGLGVSWLAVPFGACGTAEFLNAKDMKNYLGVRVTNTGPVPFDVDGTGIDIDTGSAVPSRFMYPAESYPGRPPKRLLPNSNGTWIAHIPTIGAGLKEAREKLGMPEPLAIRPYAQVASRKPDFAGEWIPLDGLQKRWMLRTALEWTEHGDTQRLQQRRDGTDVIAELVKYFADK
ncbi:hypothetical protein [Actinomadura formosensis]|uniref:hypothetical protein n=1 Tax=Actinomadura formosensis TaxID=60706 RepID=UPI003D8D700A